MHSIERSRTSHRSVVGFGWRGAVRRNVSSSAWSIVVGKVEGRRSRREHGYTGGNGLSPGAGRKRQQVESVTVVRKPGLRSMSGTYVVVSISERVYRLSPASRRGARARKGERELRGEAHTSFPLSLSPSIPFPFSLPASSTILSNLFGGSSSNASLNARRHRSNSSRRSPSRRRSINP